MPTMKSPSGWDGGKVLKGGIKTKERWRNVRNRWRNREETQGENMAIREIDLSVMNEGNGSVEWFVPVTSGLIVGCCVRGWKAMGHCDADWQPRLTRDKQFAFSLHWRLTSFSSVVSHTQTHTHKAVCPQSLTLGVSTVYDWQLKKKKKCKKINHSKIIKWSQIICCKQTINPNTRYYFNIKAEVGNTSKSI